MSDSTLEDIEIALAHQERQIGDLNDMVTRQWDEIERLKKLLLKTEGRLSEIEAGFDDSGKEPLTVAEQAALEKPPHY